MFTLMINSLPAISGVLALALAGFVITRDTRAGTNRSLALGLTVLGVYQILLAFALSTDVASWRLTIFRMAVGVSAIIPPAWLAFGVTFAECHGGTNLARWRPVILGLWASSALAWMGLGMGRVIVPVGLGAHAPVMIGLDSWGKAFQGLSLVGLALVLLHMESLYRQADRKTGHRIRFLVVGIFAAFTSQIVMVSYTLLYGVFHPWHPSLSALGLLTGEVLIAFSVVRHRLLKVDIFVSRYVVYCSLTLVVIGGYLIGLGAIAELSRWLEIGLDLATGVLLGGLGAAGLALVFLSEDMRRRVQRFLHTHFFRNKYDHRLEWMEATRRYSLAATIPDIASQTVQRALEVMWIRQAAIYTATSAPGSFTLLYQNGYDRLPTALNLAPDMVEQLRAMVGLLARREGQRVPPVVPLGWTEELEGAPVGMIVPVAARDGLTGIFVIGPEVSGKPFGVDDWDFLAALGAQAGALIQNAHLSQEAADGREMHVLARLSAFVAHDLKNAVSTLSMLAENARLHMDKPDFRIDLSRNLEEVTTRMRNLLSTLNSPSGRQTYSARTIALAGAVEDWMKDLATLAPPRITVQTLIGATPDVSVDPEQFRSVLQNLVLNAIEATPNDGTIQVETVTDDGFAVLIVRDTGAGMSQDFLSKRLFRPFQTTKTRGLGIGLYQCRQVIVQFGGTLTAESEMGKGTRMTVRLPPAQPRRELNQSFESVGSRVSAQGGR
jgi:putative PEP-CTERM system histidine kinase